MFQIKKIEVPSSNPLGVNHFPPHSKSPKTHIISRLVATTGKRRCRSRRCDVVDQSIQDFRRVCRQNLLELLLGRPTRAIPPAIDVHWTARTESFNKIYENTAGTASSSSGTATFKTVAKLVAKTFLGIPWVSSAATATVGGVLQNIHVPFAESGGVLFVGGGRPDQGHQELNEFVDDLLLLQVGALEKIFVFFFEKIGC